MIVDAFTVVGGYQIRPIKLGIDQLRSERYGSSGWMRLFAEIAARRLPVFYNTGGQDIYRRSPVATQHRTR